MFIGMCLYLSPFGGTQACRGGSCTRKGRSGLEKSSASSKKRRGKLVKIGLRRKQYVMCTWKGGEGFRRLQECKSLVDLNVQASRQAVEEEREMAELERQQKLQAEANAEEVIED